jgi:hypothetical protein
MTKLRLPRKLKKDVKKYFKGAKPSLRLRAWARRAGRRMQLREKARQ